MLRRVLLIIGFLACLLSLHAQDPIFSQFYSAPLQINPAFTGNTYAPHISLNYRNQWPGWADGSSAYVTYAAYYDQFSKKLNSGFGLSILSDDAGGGLISTNKLSGYFSYRLQVVDDFYLKLGVEASAVQARFGWDKFVFLDQINERYGTVSPGGTPYPTEEVRPENLNSTYFDVSAGILAYNEIFYAGLSLKHLNTPNESLLNINDNINTGLPMRVALHGGMELKIREGNNRRAASFISPNIMYLKQGDFGQLNLGALANLDMIFGGVWYRHAFTNPDAVILVLGVHKGVMKIGYSYDISVGKLSGQSNGSHEVSLTLNFDKGKRIDYNDCFQLLR
jgi:type IX secretion system PorP/SprF family membrane protein